MEYLQQLEIECPFCGETQPRETALWDEDGVGYTTICQTCGKMFCGLAPVSAYTERVGPARSMTNG
jgi:transcription elongation factor Elf1